MVIDYLKTFVPIIDLLFLKKSILSSKCMKKENVKLAFRTSLVNIVRCLLGVKLLCPIFSFFRFRSFIV